MSNLLGPSTPVTSAPNDLAICTAKVPTPPPAPLIKTFCPGRIFPLSDRRKLGEDDPTPRRFWRALDPAEGTAAASSNVILAGFSLNAFSGTHTYSAKAPKPNGKDKSPQISSPGRKCFTFLPTASMRPAISDPSILCIGFRGPVKRALHVPLRISRSAAFKDAACTFTSASSSLGVGFSTSLSSRTSGAPYFVHTIAFMVFSPNSFDRHHKSGLTFRVSPFPSEPNNQ